MVRATDRKRWREKDGKAQPKPYMGHEWHHQVVVLVRCGSEGHRRHGSSNESSHTEGRMAFMVLCFASPVTFYTRRLVPHQIRNQFLRCSSTGRKRNWLCYRPRDLQLIASLCQHPIFLFGPPRLASFFAAVLSGRSIRVLFA
jgi:hypothetical protein